MPEAAIEKDGSARGHADRDGRLDGTIAVCTGKVVLQMAAGHDIEIAAVCF